VNCSMWDVATRSCLLPGRIVSRRSTEKNILSDAGMASNVSERRTTSGHENNPDCARGWTSSACFCACLLPKRFRRVRRMFGTCIGHCKRLDSAGATPSQGCRYQIQPAASQKAPHSLAHVARGCIEHASPRCWCRNMAPTICALSDQKRP